MQFREQMAEQVAKALNTGGDFIVESLGLGERDQDLINLVVSAALALLANPDASFDEIVTSNYPQTPEVVRGWWTNWGQL